jgi:hypothetical protein
MKYFIWKIKMNKPLKCKLCGSKASVKPNNCGGEFEITCHQVTHKIKVWAMTKKTAIKRWNKLMMDSSKKPVAKVGTPQKNKPIKDMSECSDTKSFPKSWGY